MAAPVVERRAPLTDDFTYSSASLARPLMPRELPRHLLALHHTFGIETHRRNNIHVLAHDVVATIVGNTVQVVDLISHKVSTVFGHGDGVGALCVHPDRTHFAVAEKGVSPAVYVYEYPSLKVCRVLRKGTEQAYSAAVFSADGKTLATVGSFPDYLLTVWNWREESMVLRTKAFSQEVFNVQFSPADSGILATSGTGHIRFWSMAETFTGLKLQGALGKFGRVDLSDIDAFAILPDGKVLSSSESGSLLLWEGVFIKCEIAMPDATGDELLPPHKGPVRVVLLDLPARTIVTGGADGFLRWWPFDAVDQAELGEDALKFVLEPTMEAYLGEGVDVRGVAKAKDGSHWVVQDASGGVWRVDAESGDADKVVSGHGGAVACLDASPVDHFAASAGADGTVRCWDYVDRKMLFTARHQQAATFLRWLPTCVDPTARHIAVGFDDGVVRLLYRAKEEWKRVQVLKPHVQAVTALEFSPSGKLMATGSTDGTVFLLRATARPDDAALPVAIEPIGFVSVPGEVRSISWLADSSSVMVSCGTGGGLLHMPIPSSFRATTTSFDLELPFARYSVQLPPMVVELPSPTRSRAAAAEGKGEEDEAGEDEAGEGGAGEGKGEEDGEEAPPEPVQAPQPRPLGPTVAVLVHPEQVEGRGPRLLVTTEGTGCDAVHEVFLDGEPDMASTHAVTVVDSAPTPTPKVTRCLRVSTSGRLLVTGGCDGAATVRPLSHTGYFARIGLHDSFSSDVTAALTSFDDHFLLTSATDGVVGVVAVRPNDIVTDAQAATERAADVLVELVVPKPRRKAAAAAAPDALTAPDADAGGDAHAEAEAKSKADADTAGGGGAVESKAADEGAADAACVRAGAGAGVSGASPTRAADADAEDVPDMAELNDAKVFIPMAVSELDGVVFPLPPSSVPTDAHDEGKEAGVQEADDITDPTAYSIQDAKLKKEEDNRRMAAEKKKAAVRVEIEALRKRFAALRAASDAEPNPAHRLTPEELVIDPELVQQFRAQGAARVREVGQTLAFESERARLLEQKLRRRFLDVVEVEHTRLTAFRTGQSVASFRTTYLPDHVREALKQVHALIQAEQRNQDAMAHVVAVSPTSAAGSGAGTGRAGVGAGAAAGAGARAGAGATKGGTRTGGAEEKKSSFEVRKELRLKRQAELAALAAEQPGPDAEDPADVAAVEDARTNMGDYKLKSDPSYEVPAERRVDATKKRRQMLLLEESVHAIRMNFNRRFLALHSLKRVITAQVAADNETIGRINMDLGLSQQLWDPVVPPEEWPEWRTKVDASTLQRWRDAKADLAATEGKGFPPTPKPDPAPALDDAGLLRAAQEANVIVAAACGVASVGLPAPLANLPVVNGCDRVTVGDPSPLELDEMEEKRIKLEAAKEQLLQRQQKTIDDFDSALYQLRRQRLRLEADLKSASMRLIYLYRELVLLRNMAKEDAALLAKLDKATKDKSDIGSKIAECNDKLSVKQAEIEVWQEKDREILADFHDLVMESHPAHAALLKIFKRKVKRSKKRAGDSDMESDDSGSDYDDDSEYDEDEDEDEDDSCPPGCDQSLYDKVLELREKRLDQEDVLSDFQKSIDDLKKAHDRHSQRLRQVDKDLAATNAEIRKFQREKQSRLNQIEVMVSLTLSQIIIPPPGSMEPEPEAVKPSGSSRRLTDLAHGSVVTEDSSSELAGRTGGAGRLPASAAQLVVFNSDALSDLRAQTGRLREENKTRRRDFRNLHKQQRELQSEKKHTEQQISELRAKAVDLQMLKFGQLVQLEALDKMSSSTRAKKMEADIAAQESSQRGDVGSLRKHIQQQQMTMLQLTQDNTKLLREIGELTAEQASLERELNSQASGGMHVADAGPGAKTEVDERNSLMQLVKLQANEMEVLKSEISVLRRKGGQVYSQAGV